MRRDHRARLLTTSTELLFRARNPHLANVALQAWRRFAAEGRFLIQQAEDRGSPLDCLEICKFEIKFPELIVPEFGI